MTELIAVSTEKIQLDIYMYVYIHTHTYVYMCIYTYIFKLLSAGELVFRREREGERALR